MATENIRIKYVVDDKQLEESNKELNKTAKANDQVQKEVDQTNEKFKTQEKQLSKTNKAFAGLGGQLTAIGNRFQIAGKGVGDLASGLFKATTATTGTTKAMRLLRVAIAATGVGLLVVALGSLAAAFKSSEGGQNKFIKIMGAIGVVIGNVSDVFASFGEQLISFFSGDGFDTSKITDAFDDLINKTGEEIAIQQKLADKTAQTNIIEREFLVKTAKLETTIAALRLKARQENQFSAKERVAAIIEARDLQNDLLQTEITIAKNRAEEQRIQNSFSKSTKENLDDLARLEAAVFQLETKRFNQEKTIQRELNTTRAQARTEERKIQKARQAEIDKAEQSRLEQLEAEAETLEARKAAASELAVFRAEQANNLELAELERTRRLLQNDELLAEERILIAEEYEANIKQIREDAAANEISVSEKLAKQNKDISSASLNNDIDIANKSVEIVKETANTESVIGKAAATAQAGINIAQGITKALATANLPLAALIGILGAVQISKIIGITPKFEKGGKIGGNLHSGGGTLIEAERDEYMMSRKATSKYGFDFMDKVNNLELNELTGTSTSGNINIVDVKPIADQLKNMPQNIVNVDSEGFALHQRRGQSMMSQKIERYST